MSAARTERLLNLMFVLLNASRPIEREDLRTRVPGYADKNDAAFERLFERDKKELKDQGIPLETRPIDVFQEDVVGYIIDRKDWLLPEVALDSEERILLSLAASAWQDAQVSSIAYSALDRVTDPSLDLPIRPGIGRRQPNFAEIFQAVTEQRVIEFDYRNRDGAQIMRRVLEPWKMLLSSGSWYVAGFDQIRQEQRIFKLSRIVGSVEVTKNSILHHIPSDLDLTTAVSEWRRENSVEQEAQVRVPLKTCANLRLLASDIQASGDTHELLSIPFTDEYQLVREISKVCDMAQVLTPEDLREAVSHHISRSARLHGLSGGDDRG